MFTTSLPSVMSMCIASAESLAAIKFRVPARFRNRGPRERRVIPLRAAAAQAPATMKLRVLALHSFRTSGSIFCDQLEALGNWPNAIGDLCEFVYVDAPHPASGEVPEDVASFFQGPYFEWWNATSFGVEGKEGKVLQYEGLERSLEFVEEVWRTKGPFDGIVGFSQGATFTGLLAATGKVEGRGPFVPRDAGDPGAFAIFISGMQARTEEAKRLYTEASGEMGMDIATLHIVGETDRAIPPAMSDRASQMFVEERRAVIRHGRGHVVPRLDGDNLKSVRSWLQEQLNAKGRYRAGGTTAAL